MLFLLLGLFTIASLVFYHPEDLPFFASTPNTPVLNYTGLTGAYVAHGLLISFGLGSYLIPFLLLIWSWCFFNQRVPERKIFKLVGLVIALVASSVFIAISFYAEKRFLRGGAVGYFLGTELLHYFGSLGSYIVTGSCLLLAMLLATDFMIYPMTKGFWKNFSKFFSSFAAQWSRFREWGDELRVRWHRPEREARVTRKEPLPSVVGSYEKMIPQPLKIKTDLPPGALPKVEKIREKIQQEPVIRQEVAPKPKKGFSDSRRELKKELSESVAQTTTPEGGDYQLPPLSLLRTPEAAPIQMDDLRYQSSVVEETLAEFGIEAKVVEVEQGPVITRFELLPAPGVKVTRISSLGDDLALALKATSLRFITPIPGKSAIGIEIPNSTTRVVFLRELLEAPEFQDRSIELPLAIGKDTSGKPLVADLTQMPHLLIAGTTGSGKTVCVNSIIAGLLRRTKPSELKFVMIDPKMVELAVYNTIPHMMSPVVTDPKKAAATLGWVLNEMENRYRLFAGRGVRNIQTFNSQSEERLPYIVVVIDELADLMMVAQDKVESAITRLAQLSRAVGIHLILATQRPSVDVITGVIKANFPARISFKVASKVDSRTVLDMNGADKLLGKGDFLFLQPG